MGHRHFSVGEEATLSKTITEQDVVDFARLSGDGNPLHLDEAYARGTRFGGRIAHGLLVAGLISAVLGTKLPGPGAVYRSQHLEFKRPVRLGDRVTARVRVAAWNAERGHMTVTTEVIDAEGRPVIEGEARLVVPVPSEGGA
jgi:3-hydroxybutyryl-CoA dehydratase